MRFVRQWGHTAVQRSIDRNDRTHQEAQPMNDPQRHDPDRLDESGAPTGWGAAEAVGDVRTKRSYSPRDTGSEAGDSRPKSITEAFRVLKLVRESIGPCADDALSQELCAPELSCRTARRERGRRSRSGEKRSGDTARGLLIGWVLVIISAVAPIGAVEEQSQGKPHFQPGDAVKISVLADSTAFLEGLYHIDDSGTIFLPIVGRTRVTDQTVEELTHYLDSVYLKYLRYPDVRVQRMVRLSFLGGFHQPGLYYVDPHLSLWDALAQAGGPTRQDGLQKLHWERGDRLVDDNLVPELRNGQSLVELGVESGDLIWVTDKPKRGGWEVFRDDVMPLLSLSLSILTAGLALYAVIEED
ncbi:MAG: hypothetical protein GF331_18360 [Chitinivibrionales bacterium]|nr:hypothetical protein [Chitinivibrionales bacterium]